MLASDLSDFGSNNYSLQNMYTMLTIDIALYLKTTHQVIVSHSCIKRIVKANNYSRRKPAKTLAIGESVHRKQQFEIVFFLIAFFLDMDDNKEHLIKDACPKCNAEKVKYASTVSF